MASIISYTKAKIDSLLGLKADSGHLHDDRYSLLGHGHAAASVSDFAEAVDDRVNALIVQGTNITKVYDDAAGTLTLSAAGGGAAASLLHTTAPIGWWMTAASIASTGDMAVSPTGYQYPSRYEIPVAGSFDAVAMKIQTAEAGVNGKILLYNSNALGMPKDLVYTSAPVSLATAGDPVLTLAPLVLPAGVYWGFFRTDVAGTGVARIKGVMQSFKGGDMHPEGFHTAQATIGATWIKCDPGSYASPAATISGMSVDYNTSNNNRPSFGLRRSA